METPTGASAQEEPHLKAKKKKKKKQSSWFNPQVLLPQLLLTTRVRRQTICASHNFKLWVTIIQLPERFTKKQGEKPQRKRKQRKKTRDEIRDCPTFGTISLPQTEPRAEGSWRQPKCSCSVGLCSEEGIQAQRSHPHRKLRSAAQAWQFHVTVAKKKNFQETLLQPLITELWSESN